MYVKVDGQEWKLDFLYSEEEIYTGWALETFRVTYCNFVSGDSEYSAMSVCKPPDNFCKATGRKKALTSMLKSAFPNTSEESKNKRKQVWEQYWATVRQ